MVNFIIKKLHIDRIENIAKKLSILLIVSITVSLLVLVCLMDGTNYIMDEVFANTSFRKNVSTQLVNDFQEYVTENDIKATDTELIREWEEDNHIAYFTVSRKRMLIYDNSYTGQIPLIKTESEQLHYTWMFFSQVEFKDGEADVFIYRDNERAYYIIADVIIAIICTVIGVLFFYQGTKKEITYNIIDLKAQITKMNDDMESNSIEISGNDEIADLANAIETMRRELIAREKYEQTLKLEQDKLVLGMAHDLRTPLTSLMAYVEIIKRQTELEQIQKYSDKVLQRAVYIKELSNQLFEFFLANSTEKPGIEEIDNIEYALGDYISELYSSLEAEGFLLNSDNMNWVDVKIRISFDYLLRIINNIQSNIVKYASRLEPVIFSTCYTDKYFIIRIENTAADNINEISGNGIGEKNMHFMMEKMNGYCDTEKTENIYRIDLAFYCI